MIRANRLPLLCALLAVLLGTSCTSDNASTVAPTESPDAPAPILAAYTGIPFGPFGLWTLNKLEWGPGPFTASHNFIIADTLILQINAARLKGHRLIVAMAGGESKNYLTNGLFDLSKWKKRMDTYKTTAIKTAVANAVSDGTIIGDMLIDEPETKQWGGNITKAMIDQMALYVKAIFPTLPVGVNHGPPGYNWRSTERYTKVDYAVYQYAWWVTRGDLTTWKNAVLARAKLDGVTPGLSLNVINGGVQDRDGVYDCKGTGQGGLGFRTPNCHMTPDQIRTWGKTLAPLGCVMLVWTFDQTYMSNTNNLAAFKDVAALAASTPRRSCKRV